MNIVIRAVRISDLPDLMRMIRAKAEFDGAETPLSINESQLREALFSERPRMRALVALVDGHIEGIATYYDIFSSFLGKPGLWLDDLYVDETHRSRGLGKLLMEKICAEAARMGCERIDWLVATSNARGQAFYKNLGADISQTVQHVRLGREEILSLAAKEPPDMAAR